MLGIEWDKFEDAFIIDLHKIFKNGFNSPVTKYFQANRKYLRSLIYDYFTNSSFIQNLFQKLTTPNNNWDTDVNLEVTSECIKLFNSLQFLKFTVQRFYLPSIIFLTDRKFDIHGFSDTSKNAYAAVVYLAYSILQYFVGIKNPWSPLQTTSITRIELIACLLLSKLIEAVVQLVILSISKTYIVGRTS